MHRIFIIFVVVFGIFNANAQRAKGSWMDYLSYTKATKIALAPNKVFCATEGGLMYFDIEDNGVYRISEIAPLSDFGIKTIAYSTSAKMLVVVYTNCNIDLISEEGVFNISDIKRKQISSEKTINNVTVIGTDAYLSCGFGIVVVNLQKKEIKDTYIIGDGGSYLAVNDVEADDEFLYAATDKGVLKAAKTGVNLLDFSNWVRETGIQFNDKKFSHLAYHNGKIIANYTPDEWDKDQLFILNGTNWETYMPQIRYAYDIQTNGKYLAITSREQVFIINDQYQLVKEINRYKLGNTEVSPIVTRSSAVAENGTIWIADNQNSLVKVSGENFEQILLNGPIDNTIFSLNQSGNSLWVAPGGKSGWETPRFQRFENAQNKWTSFVKGSNPELDGFFNIVSIIADPKNPARFFVGSWGGGLLEYNNDKFVKRYTNKNSPLETSLPNQPDEPYVRVGGFDFDSEGNLWVTNSTAAHNLHKLSVDGKWTSFVLPEVATKYNISDVLVTRRDDKWVIAPKGYDAYVVNKSGEEIKRLLVTAYFNNGVYEEYKRMSDIYSIAEDNEGAIWIGTSMGVAVYSNPSRVWETGNFYATRPSLDLNDGIFHPLLETETVTAIAVDGANRKWLGTRNSGVYLVNENGTKELSHFTTQNSPLFSDYITSISINQKNGEVFIGTDKGLISFMGDANQGATGYDSVYVYPNPVRETYDGPVTITNLIENSEVKITDIAGNLVFRTTSLGGQAIWDGKNLNGRRVKTGVYLVFCNDENGEETHVTKLLFIH